MTLVGSMTVERPSRAAASRATRPPSDALPPAVDLASVDSVTHRRDARRTGAVDRVPHGGDA